MSSTMIKNIDATESVALSAALRTHTAQAHEEAEQTTFMNELLKGELNVEEFIRLQEQSWFFYTALEEAVRACAEDPRAQQILDIRLERQGALVRDLNALHGDSGWQSRAQPTPATAIYVRRLNEIATTKDFPRLVAHHYVRYLGDLSGGQVIARMMVNHYGISQDALAFYRFEDLGKLKPYKDSYRDALDALELTSEERAALLDEAYNVFILNQNVFASLG